MDTKYKIYNASEYDNLDLTLFYESIKWNLAETQFMVEFKQPPHGNTVTLTQEEARAIITGPEWRNTEIL